MERCVGLEHAVCELERLAERRRLEIRAVARRMHVREVENRPHPRHAPSDVDDVVHRPEVSNTTHDLDAERHRSPFLLEPLAERAQLPDDRVDRVLTAPSEEESGMEHDELGAARGHDARAAVEGADGRGELPPARLEVAHEAEQWSVHGQRDIVLARELAESLGERVVHPEAALEVDLARRVPSLEEELDRLLGRLARRHACRPDADPRRHPAIVEADVIAFAA